MEFRQPTTANMLAATGNITLNFNYPVDLKMLKTALQVVPGGQGGASGHSVVVYPCQSEFEVVLANAALSPNRNGVIQNSTCAVVQIQPPLPVGVFAKLQLPAGACYSPVAGAVKNKTEYWVSCEVWALCTNCWSALRGTSAPDPCAFVVDSSCW